jgi:hypothetical protein
MVWRKELLEAFGGFDVRVGVRGQYLSVGEETVLYHKVWQSFHHPVFYYSPEVRVRHWGVPFKMTVSYQWKRAFVAGQVWSKVRGPRGLHRRLSYLIGWLPAIAKMGYRALMRRRLYRYRENWLIEELGPVLLKIGSLFEILGLKVRLRQRK